jgi:hypothetical protein
MAGEAEWTDPAERQLTAYLDDLSQVRPELVGEALYDLRQDLSAVDPSSE